MTPGARDAERDTFIEQQGWGGASVKPLPQDASFRRYFRLKRGSEAVLLMDAPPEREDTRPFVRIARHLRDLDLHAPQIFAHDENGGWVMLEDFGDATFTSLIDSGEDESVLYEMAVDTLIALHRHPDAVRIEAPPYDLTRLLDEAALFTDWFYPAVTRQPIGTEPRTAYLAAWESIFLALPTPSISLVLRDFHVDNLMRVPQGGNPPACGLLDFQDALIGPTAYDLVSLLQDARRDIAPSFAQQFIQRYFAAFPLVAVENFMTWYHVLGAQRHCKVAGIFLRLCLRDQKDQYLIHMPRVIRLLEGTLDIPTLAPLKAWLKLYLPELPHAFDNLDLDHLRQVAGPSHRPTDSP